MDNLVNEHVASAPEGLSAESKAWLLVWARKCIAAALRNEAAAQPDAIPEQVQVPRGCFVTLHRRDGTLRGCIGTFDETTPLWENVGEMGVAAATRDPRFAPVSNAELGDCRLDISVLTPRRPAVAQDVQVGRHGVWIEQGRRRGVLLPQVAVEHGWDRDTFLAHTCRKAGLPPTAWQERTSRIEVFEAEVIEES